MLTEQELTETVNLLKRRQVSLYHACQYTDLITYIEIGGIPSRQRMEVVDASFTPFDTDASDRENGVWDKVFLNLTDFGTTFAKGQRAVPNPYGPILLHVRPEALLEASDVAICLRSAGGQQFDRELESLSTAADVDRLFAYGESDGYRRSALVRFRKELREEFGLETASEPEISCSIRRGFLPFRYISKLVVDPYVIGEQSLRHHVREVWPSQYPFVSVIERSADVGARRYHELAELVWTATPGLADFEEWDVSDGFREWARSVDQIGLGWQFRRYADYIRTGTFAPLANN